MARTCGTRRNTRKSVAVTFSTNDDIDGDDDDDDDYRDECMLL